MSQDSDTRYLGERDFKRYYGNTHLDGILDRKTKYLIHLAVVLALKCEPCSVISIENLKKVGASDEEIGEAIQLTGAVGAGAIIAMANRAHASADAEHYWWRADGAPSEEPGDEVAAST